MAEGGFILPVLRTYSFEAIGWLVLTQQPLFEPPTPNTPGQSFELILAPPQVAPTIGLLVAAAHVIVTTDTDLSDWTAEVVIYYTKPS